MLYKYGFDTTNVNSAPIDLNRILNGFYSLLNSHKSEHLDPLYVLSNFRGYPEWNNPNRIVGDYAGASTMIIVQSMVKVIGTNRGQFVNENSSIE